MAVVHSAVSLAEPLSARSTHASRPSTSPVAFAFSAYVGEPSSSRFARMTALPLSLKYLQCGHEEGAAGALLACGVVTVYSEWGPVRV